MKKIGSGKYNWLRAEEDLLCCVSKVSIFSFQGSFPGNLQLVLVLRPTTLLQRTLSDILFKFNKDEFKMKVPVCTAILTSGITVVYKFNSTYLKKNDHFTRVLRCDLYVYGWVSGDHVELNNRAAFLHWPHPADTGTRGNAGVLPREVDRTPHCMYKI